MDTWKYTIKRLTHGIIVLWVIVTVLFSVRLLYPGDPVYLMVPETANKETIEAIRQQMGFNDPWHVQYLDYMSDLVRGDMGQSYQAHVSVNDRIAARLPATIELAVASTLISIGLAIPFGVISATNRNKITDDIVSLLSLVGVSTPNFWLGILLILLFPVMLGIGPVSGRGMGFVNGILMLFTEFSSRGLTNWFAHIILPAVSLGTYYTALLTRLTRGEMLEEFGQLYIRAAESKGLWKTLILYKHALRNSLIPLITVLAINFGLMMGGAIVVEMVFAWPGMGTLFINAVKSLDWPIINGVLIITGMAFLSTNLVADILYTYADPEVELE